MFIVGVYPKRCGLFFLYMQLTSEEEASLLEELVSLIKDSIPYIEKILYLPEHIHSFFEQVKTDVSASHNKVDLRNSVNKDVEEIIVDYLI
jgi:hypothetical protein